MTSCIYLTCYLSHGPWIHGRFSILGSVVFFTPYLYLGTDVCSSIIKQFFKNRMLFDSGQKMGQKNSKNETLNLNEIGQLETEDVFKKDR